MQLQIVTKKFTGLTNDRTYYAKVFTVNPRGRVNNRADLKSTMVILPNFIPLYGLDEGTVIMVPESTGESNMYAPAPFLLAKHDYKPEANGYGRTLLARKNLTTAIEFGLGSFTAYNSATLDRYLTHDYKALLPQSVQDAIGKTTFNVTIKSNPIRITTLSKSVFTPSATEYGQDKSFVGTEGEKIDVLYNNIIASDGSGINQDYWTRSMSTVSIGAAAYVNTSGEVWNATGSTLKYARPCFTLPAESTYVNETPNTDGSYNLVVYSLQ